MGKRLFWPYLRHSPLRSDVVPACRRHVADVSEAETCEVFRGIPVVCPPGGNGMVVATISNAAVFAPIIRPTEGV